MDRYNETGIITRRVLFPQNIGGEEDDSITVTTEYKSEDAPVPARSGGAATIVLAASLLCVLTVFTVIMGCVMLIDDFFSGDMNSAAISELYAGSITFAEYDESEDYGADITGDGISGSAYQPSVSGSSEGDSNGNAAVPLADDTKYPIVKYDLSSKAAGGIEIKNETDYSPDLGYLLDSAPGIENADSLYAEYGSDAPIALIYHTHATESYSDLSTDTNVYRKSDSFRTGDTSQNVVAVGSVMTDILNDCGVNTIHCTELFDSESYRDSYNRSSAALQKYLSEYPSIKYVFDVHRDSVIDASFTKLRPLTSVSGYDTAQVMLLVGTDDKGADHPTWNENLSFALKLQSSLYSISDTLMRPIDLRGAAFNQKYTPASLLIEVGSCGNTLVEAKRGGAVTAVSVAEMILGKKAEFDTAKVIDSYCG